MSCNPNPDCTVNADNLLISNCATDGKVGTLYKFQWLGSEAGIDWNYTEIDSCLTDSQGIPGLKFDEASGLWQGTPTQAGVYTGNTIATGKQSKVAVTWTVTISADPHFTSFHGEKFDFHGEPNRHYNLLSDKNVQINALFKEWEGVPEREGFTSIAEMGIKWRNLRIKMDAINKQLTLNDVHVYDCVFPGGWLKVVKSLPERYVETTKSMVGFGTYVFGFLVYLQGYQLFIPVSTNRKHPTHPTYLNFIANIDFEGVGVDDVHGIVGQTVMYTGYERTSTGPNGEGIVEGHYSDYEVSDLWADDFKYNKHGEE